MTGLPLPDVSDETLVGFMVSNVEYLLADAEHNRDRLLSELSDLIQEARRQHRGPKHWFRQLSRALQGAES
jgi:hypothetical protein